MASSAASSLKAPKDSNGAAVTLGVGDRIGEGDTSLILDILDNDCPEETASNIIIIKADRTKKDFFKELQKEVKWNVMLHRGMLNYSSHYPVAVTYFLKAGRFRGWLLFKEK
jgi:hypothetical protein